MVNDGAFVEAIAESIRKLQSECATFFASRAGEITLPKQENVVL